MQDVEELPPEDARSSAIRNSLYFIPFQWRAEALTRTLRVKARNCIQPSDIIATIAPVDPTDSTRILIIHRCILRCGEYERHIVCIPTSVSTSSLPQPDCVSLNEAAFISTVNSRGDRIVYVDKILMKEKHGGERVHPTASKIPVTRTLENGEKYVIYRCSLFVDAFLATTMYVQAKYEGVYVQPLTVSAERKVDSASARVVSLVPPGVDLTPIIKQFYDDCLETLKTATYVTDANGEKRRLIMDVVNISWM